MPEITTIPQYQPLFDEGHEHYRTRYMIWYGGRYSAKSTQVARGLLVRGTREKLLYPCIREVQKSIKDSVKRLLENQIAALGMSSFYRSYDDRIIGRNGTEFVFLGMQEHVAKNVKSFEGADGAWIEEADTLSEKSWEFLIPTMRKEGSQIFATFNPSLETDPVWRRFVMRKRDDAYVCRVNWTDLPHEWLTDTIRREIKDLKEIDYDSYLHVYGGECRQYSDDIIIPPALIRLAADGGMVQVYPGTPLTIAIDPARLGNDRIVVSHKIGRNITKIQRYPRQRLDETAAQLIHEIDRYDPIKVFIDCGGLGVGIFDMLVGAGYGSKVVKVDFGGSSSNPDRWENKRAEMYELFLEWLQDSPCHIHADVLTVDQLSIEAAAVKKYWKNNRILALIKKEDIKKELGYSPDNLDSLVLHFASPIAPGEIAGANYTNRSFQVQTGFSVI